MFQSEGKVMRNYRVALSDKVMRNCMVVFLTKEQAIRNCKIVSRNKCMIIEHILDDEFEYVY